jgi:hypothetical protein
VGLCCQQQLYESVRTDRNNYSKSLIEAQDEIAEMKREAKIMNHQIEQLKEEITSKVRQEPTKPNQGSHSNIPASCLMSLAGPSPGAGAFRLQGGG